MRFKIAASPILVLWILLAPFLMADELSTKPNTTQIEINNIEPIVTEKPSTEEKNFIQRTLLRLETLRDKTSNRYLHMSKSIDEYFYGRKLEDTTNKSFIKLELKNTLYKQGRQEQDIKLRAKLDLPNTESRLKLVFTSSADTQKKLEDRVTDDASGERVTKDSSLAGIEYTPDPNKSEWKTSYSAGIKLRTRPLLFTKLDIDNSWKLPDNWSSAFEQTFWYYEDDGLGETSQARLSKPINDDYRMEISSELEFRDKDDRFYYDLILSTTHRLSETSSIGYYTGALGASQPTNQITNYVIGANYRKLLHEDWLFFTIEPGFSFPRDENWNPQPSLTLRLQIFFTGQQK